MTNKNILDNLNGQEIKEMINNGKIVLEDLDVSALEKLFDYETDMLCLDEGDMGLINACAKRLDELNGPAMSEEHFWAVINKADAEIVSDKKETAPVDVPVKALSRAVKRRSISKKIWIVAAAIALLASMATITSSAFGFNIFEYFKEVISLSAGEKVDKGTITLINRGEAKEYSSIEELLKQENINILYPNVLPDGVEIETVRISEDLEGECIRILTNDPSVNIAVYTAIPLRDDTFEDCEVVEIKSVTFYVRKNLNSAYCYHNNCYYSFQTNSYESIILIIENLKEY